MDKPKTQRQRSEDRRQQIIQIAEQLCAKAGPEGIKLREVARQAGIAAPSIYNHFQSLDDLLAAIVEKHLAQMTECYLEAQAKRPDQAMHHICVGHFRLLAQTPGIARLLLNDFSSIAGARSISQNAARIQELNEMEAAIILDGTNQKLFRKVIPQDVIIARLGMSLTLLSETGGAMTRERQHQIEETISDFVLSYLRISP